ncbi:hypothetical protein F7725_000720, partial [Dissostichus mawsoni]
MQGMQSLQGDSEGTEGERQGAVSTTHPSTLSLHQHLGSGGPPPLSIMLKSQSTAALSGHSADKLVREEKRRDRIEEKKEKGKKRREEKIREEKIRTFGETGGNSSWEAWVRGRVLWVHCTVKEWACSPPGWVGNGW